MREILIFCAMAIYAGLKQMEKVVHFVVITEVFTSYANELISVSYNGRHGLFEVIHRQDFASK